MNKNTVSWRDRLLDAVVASRVLDLYQRLAGRTCTVLLYHSVAGGRGVPYFDGDVYAEHMDMLVAEFRVVAAAEYVWHMLNDKPFPPRTILVTFDDGFANNHSIVRPIMQRRQLPWVLFSTTQALDEPDQPLWFVAIRAICLFTPQSRISLLGRDWELGDSGHRSMSIKLMVEWVRQRPVRESINEIRNAYEAVRPHLPEDFVENFCKMLTADQLYELDASPLVEIGGHTHSHPYLTSVPDELLHSEIDEPTARLASLLGRRIRMFAYPIGWYGQRELDRMAQLGFDCAFAVLPRIGRTPRYEIPRTGIYVASRSVMRAKSLGLETLLSSAGVKKG